MVNDVDGRPHGDRSWIECFAQLVGTVLSLWDDAALDAAGQDGEVAPTFINLADASIKMVGIQPSDVYHGPDIWAIDRDITHSLTRRSTPAKCSQHIHGRKESVSPAF